MICEMNLYGSCQARKNLANYSTQTKSKTKSFCCLPAIYSLFTVLTFYVLPCLNTITVMPFITLSSYFMSRYEYKKGIAPASLLAGEQSLFCIRIACRNAKIISLRIVEHDEHPLNHISYVL